MKIIKTRPEYSIINVRFLILIYALLCLLTFLFSRIFFINTLHDGKVPDRLNLIVFFTIPSVLIIIFLVSVYNLFLDFFHRRPGSKFSARLLVYFLIIVIFSVAPITIMTGTALNEIVRFWQSIDTASAVRSSNNFIAENYLFHMDKFNSIIRQNDFTSITSLPDDITSVQIFHLSDENWEQRSFMGDEQFKLNIPPALETGFVIRELPRDNAVIRYAQRRSNLIYLVNYYLGGDFDTGMNAIANQSERFNTISVLRENLQPLLFYYYIVFFLPTILMTIITAISFTRRVTHPIVELTDATRRVAEGDFSIQILSRRDDELGILISSFNAMVQDLEKSRAALVKNETITIWQNMAQQLAHEIKNPLTPVKLSAERVLRRWQKSPETIHEILESSMIAIIQETERLSILLNEFRTLSKPIEPSNSWTEIFEPVEETVNAYSSSYPHVRFEIYHTVNNVTVKIDKQRLSQILANLLVNAIDSMDGAGIIELRTDLVKKREVCYCRISIRDSGKGISTQEAASIFTPYFTTKETGTGLGLSIVKRIVNDHEGDIWFDSAENIGTTFYVDLVAEEK